MPNELFTAGAYDRNLLHYYALKGKASKCRTLMEKDDFNVNRGDNLGRTSLMLAVSMQQYYVVQILLDHGASPYMLDKYGLSAIHYCFFRDDVPMLQLILGSDNGEFQQFMELRCSEPRIMCPITLSIMLEANGCTNVLLKIWSPDVLSPKITPPGLLELDGNVKDCVSFQHLFDELKSCTLLNLAAKGFNKDAHFTKKVMDSDKQRLVNVTEKEVKRNVINIASYLRQIFPSSKQEFAPSGVLAYGIYLATKDGVCLTLAKKGSHTFEEIFSRKALQRLSSLIKCKLVFWRVLHIYVQQ